MTAMGVSPRTTRGRRGAVSGTERPGSAYEPPVHSRGRHPVSGQAEPPLAPAPSPGPQQAAPQRLLGEVL
ncbi:unnamed protein product [Lampetra fluviatilis]